MSRDTSNGRMAAYPAGITIADAEALTGHRVTITEQRDDTADPVAAALDEVRTCLALAAPLPPGATGPGPQTQYGHLMALRDVYAPADVRRVIAAALLGEEGRAEYAPGERKLASLDGDPVRTADDIRERLAGFAPEFVEGVIRRWRPGLRVRFKVVFPGGRNTAEPSGELSGGDEAKP